MENNILPFGKYKGKPLEILITDKTYSDWLLQQDWFVNKYNNLYNIVVNNFHEPTNTPEHNAIQINFLENDYRIKLALYFNIDFFKYDKNFIVEKIDSMFKFYEAKRLEFIEKEKVNYENAITDLLQNTSTQLYRYKRYNSYLPNVRYSFSKEEVERNHILELDEINKEINLIKEISKNWILEKDFNLFYITPSNFECKGFDVNFKISYGVKLKYFKSIPDIDELEEFIKWNSLSKIENCIDDYKLYNHINFNIEIKPSIGDDFPTVLRQIKNSMPVSKIAENESVISVLLLRDYNGVGANKEQFIKYFETQGYKVVFIDELDKIEIQPIIERFQIDINTIENY